jgi:anion-transporting  ArsA/GET3 family ATPase
MDIDVDNPLAAEILQEMGAAYLAGCRKMVDALERLKAFDERNPPASQDRQTARRLELLEDAAEKVFVVVVQREALKLSGSSEDFFEKYDVPREVRMLMGTKPR